MLLENIAEDIWIYEGETVSFFGLPYSTRMTVIRLADKKLWIHSPEKITHGLKEELAGLGEVAYLVSPNKLHHLYLGEWLKAYPSARNYAAPGLARKRSDITFTKDLTDKPEDEWAGEIKQTIFKGSPLVEEVVFYHVKSSTLILTDLIENFRPESFNWWQRLVAKFTGILAPNGKTPVDWRTSFLFGKDEARESLATLIKWQPKNIVISHGECIYGQGVEFLVKSFSWLK
jgi:hypothetical protein